MTRGYPKKIVRRKKLRGKLGKKRKQEAEKNKHTMRDVKRKKSIYI